MKEVYLLNAFSLQMLQGDATVRFTEVSELPEGLTSAIGHLLIVPEGIEIDFKF